MINSVPPEVWETAKDFDYTNAYKESERKAMYPRADFISLNGCEASKLHRVGKSHDLIPPQDAALPVFSAEIMSELNEGSIDLWSIIQPVFNPASDRELSVFGLRILFSTSKDQIACDIGMHYSDHSGGGYEEIGTICLSERNRQYYSVPAYLNRTAHEDFGLYDYTSITALCDWIGYLWNGIQHRFINRPEKISFYHHRSKSSNDTCNTFQRNHIAKVQREIIIYLDDASECSVEIADHRKINLSLWSVAGHWRVIKSGKRIWIAPYYKGKDRNNESAVLSAKEYRFSEEVTDHA